MKSEQRDARLLEAYFRGRWDAPDLPVIDDRTWGDLDMDAVFGTVDRTCSSVGQSCLYDMMRRPLFDPAEIRGRAGRIETLAADLPTQNRLGKILRRLGVQTKSEVFRFLSAERDSIEDRRRYLYIGLSALAVIAIPLAILLGAKGLLLLGAVTVVNLVIHYRFKVVVAAESPSYEYLHRLLVAADRLSALEVPAVARELAELRVVSASFRKLRRRTALLITPSGVSGDIFALFMEYIRQYFLQEVTTYFLVHNEIALRRAELARIYALVGGIDALRSAAVLRAETRGLCVPEIVPGRLFEAAEAVHPLLEEPVANTLRMDGRGVIVTGSNMSGKSTFLRTLGVNQVLATTLGLAYARRMRVGAMLTVTSITNRDNIMASESHYLVEAKRLLDILAAARSERPALVIIDEILSGTNSEERIAASVAILRHLAGLNCIVVAATHDRAIASDLADTFDTRHFTHKVEEEGLQFDYTLHEGIVEAGNAIKLLRLLGYPAEIMEGLGKP
jgi:DNA mismatch repair ATPase MutS